MLKKYNREFVSSNQYETLVEMQEYASRREIELETQVKEKMQTPSPSQPAAKRSKYKDSRIGGHRGTQCSKFGNTHERVFRTLICYKFAKDGHYSRDFNQKAQGVGICFYCNQMGHIKAPCPFLNTTVGIQVPAPTTLRITYGKQGGVEAPRTTGRAFQLIAEEAREALENMVGCSTDRWKDHME